MKSYLVIIGKPRYLGLLHSDDVDLDKGMEVIISSARGEEIGVVAGPITRSRPKRIGRNYPAMGAMGRPAERTGLQDVKYLRPVTPQDERESAS